MARMITISGTTGISFLDSYAVWASRIPNLGGRKAILDETGSCKHCGGFGECIVEGEPIRCICSILMAQDYLLEHVELFGSGYEQVQWLDIKLEVKGVGEPVRKFKAGMEYIHRWKDKLDKWLLLSGGVGTSKTMILSAIATQHHPYALYMDMGEFEQLVFRLMNNKGDGPVLDDMVQVLSAHPILLLDDIGAEYSSPFPKSILRTIINTRYQLREEYVTVAATNLGIQELTHWDMRMADRLLDAHSSAQVFFSHKSWRGG